MKVLLYGHGGSSNHGCEAIVRTTKAIVRRAIPESELLLATTKPEEDREFLQGVHLGIIDFSSRTKNLDYILSLIHLKITGDYVPFDIYQYKSLLRYERDIKMALSIGGDNYCYGNTEVLSGLNSLFRKKGLQTVLWGCSVEPNALNADVVADMKRYSMIIARESITFNALREAGVSNIGLYPDPAFTLRADTSLVSLPDINDGWVGVNLSPYLAECGSSASLTYDNYYSVINYIIDSTGCGVVLIPHVLWSHSDDRIALKQLYDKFSGTGRVMMIEGGNAEQLKGVISQCRFMVAARTHASIAAYSTCVPTLVVGYSVKAKGIAKDVFGSYENYVLPVQDLKTQYDLTKRFRWIMDHETDIRNDLQEIMPGYIAKAWDAGEALKQF